MTATYPPAQAVTHKLCARQTSHCLKFSINKGCFIMDTSNMHKERQQCNELWYTQHSDATLKILPHLLYLSLFSLLKHFKSNFRHCIISPLHISCSVATKCLVHPHSPLFPFQGHSERFCDILLYVLDLLCSANWFFLFCTTPIDMPWTIWSRKIRIKK